MIDAFRRNRALWFAGLLVLLPVLLYAALLGIVAWNQTRFIYPGAGRAAPVPDAGWRALDVVTEDHGRIRSHIRDGDPDRATVIFLHGNWGSLGSSVAATRTFVERGMKVVVVEYPGYGGNAGIPTADGLDDAAVSTFDAVVASGTSASSIVVVGNSLGSAPAIAIADRRRPAGLLLVSAFTDMRIMARRRFPLAPGFLLTDAFDNLEAIRSVRVPTMIIHGSHDDFVPVDMGRGLASAVGAPLRLVDAGHDAAYVQEAQDLAADRIEAWTGSRMAGR